MRHHGRRKKKLIVAFHFQFSNRAAWKCDTCRKQGLDTKRRCAWAGKSPDASTRVVWARGAVRLNTCPKPIITAQSLEWLERFYAHRTFGFAPVLDMAARDVDAFRVIENEINAERRRDDE